MIDYITALIECDLPEPVFGGRVISTVLGPDGEVHERTTLKRLGLEGSHSSHIHVRSVDGRTIEFKGNFAKWLQGHNLYGTDNLPDLLRRSVNLVFDRYFPDFPRPTDRQIMDAQLSRVDVTYMYHLPSAEDVESWLQAIAAKSTIAYRGRGKTIGNGDTITWGIEKGKRHSPWALVVYNKWKELLAHGSPDPDGQRGERIPALPEPFRNAEVYEWLRKCVRLELRLMGQELKRISLHGDKKHVLTSEHKSLRYVRNWRESAARLCFAQKTGRMFVGDTAVEVEEMIYVKPRVRAEYRSWLCGDDLRNGRSLATWKRLRTEIKQAYGVDISLEPPKEGDDAHLLDLRGIPAPVADESNVRRLPVKKVLRLEALPERPVWAASIETLLEMAA